MLIRTQGRKGLVDMTGMAVKVDSQKKIIAYSNHCTAYAWEVLGVYTSEEKAIKVLDMIQEEYEDANVCYIHNGFVKNKVFNMPKDCEVEV